MTGRLRLAARAVAALAMVWLLAAPVPAAAQTADSDAAQTLQSIATCVRSSNRLLLVVLIDESGSLRQTDPGNERVTAARIALRSFASLATAPVDDPPAVDVLVAGFSSRFETVVPWESLDGTSVGRVELSVGMFAERNRGIDTDFPSALIGAQNALADRSAELSRQGGDDPCKVILLFTDGKYDIETGDTPLRRAEGTEKSYAPGLSLLDPANDAAVEEAGRRALCDPAGIADRLRSDGASIVTLALAAQIAPADQQFLRALASGTAGGTSCGGTRGAEVGAYLSTNDLSQLVPLFNEVAASIAGGTRAPGTTAVEPCVGQDCVLGRRTFALSEVLGRFTAFANVGQAQVIVEVRAPDGDPIRLFAGDDGSIDHHGAQLRWSWVSRTAVNLDATLDPAAADDWIGEWSLTFVDPTGAAGDTQPFAEVFLYGGWSPDLFGDPMLLRGEETTLRFVVVDSAGNRVNTSELPEGERPPITASVVVPDAGPTNLSVFGPNREGRYAARFTAPPELESSVVELEVRLSVEVAPGVLLPATQRFELAVAAPQLYAIAPQALSLSSVRGTETATGTITVSGGRDGAACFWFEGVEWESAPTEAGDLRAEFEAPSSEASCEVVERGASRDVAVSVRPAAPGRGVASGNVLIGILADGEALRVTVPVSFDLAPPIDEALRIGLFLAILMPGVLAPIGALLLLNQALARFEPSAGVRVARVPVVVEKSFSRIMRVFATTASTEAGAPVRRWGPGGPEPDLALYLHDFVPFREGAHRSRTLRWQDLRFRAVAPRNPFGVPFGSVETRGAVVTGGVAMPMSRDARLPLALPGTWAFVLRDPGTGAVTVDGTDVGGVDSAWIGGELIVFLSDDPDADQIERLVGVVYAQLPTLANDLADRARAGGVDAPV